MITHFLISTLGFRCFTPPYKQYRMWENIELFLMIASLAILYVGCAYYLLYALKLITYKLKKFLNRKKL